MPLSFGNLFRGFVVLLLAAHVFCMYSLARTWGGEFGFHPGQAVLAAAFGLIMLVPLLWAVTVPDWPEIFTRHIKSRRRFRAGRCPGCKYDLHDRDPGNERECPECGEAFRDPEPYRFTPRIFRAFIAVNLLAWGLGCGAGEWWIAMDEYEFRREVQIAQQGEEPWHGRDRRWPGVGQLSWFADDGFSAGQGLVR